MKDAKYVFFGSPVAKAVTVFLGILSVVSGLFLIDVSVPEYNYRLGKVENLSFSKGGAGVGITHAPKPDEPGAQSMTITNSPGGWTVVVTDTQTGITEYVDCGMTLPKVEKGHMMTYRQKVGWITKIKHGSPSCV